MPQKLVTFGTFPSSLKLSLYTVMTVRPATDGGGSRQHNIASKSKETAPKLKFLDSPMSIIPNAKGVILY